MPQPSGAKGRPNLALVALGSNVTSTFGSPRETMAGAINKLTREGIVIRQTSRFYSTPCFPAGAGPDYVNAAISVHTTLGPPEFLQVLHGIEAHFGRERIERWGQRTLDLDLIAFGDLIAPDPETFEVWRALPADLQKMRAPDQLILPHPRMQDRAFVLVPLNDVAPDWRHPVFGRTVAEMMALLDKDEIAQVRPFA